LSGKFEKEIKKILILAVIRKREKFEKLLKKIENKDEKVFKQGLTNWLNCDLYVRRMRRYENCGD